MAGRASGAIVEVEVHGLDELERSWAPWEHRTEQAVLGALMQVGTLTAQVTSMRAPVLTGAFRASIKSERLDGATPAVRVSEGEGLAYGRWLEFGRRKRGAKKGGRYLPPTAKREKRNVKKKVAEATQREIERYPWPQAKM